MTREEKLEMVNAFCELNTEECYNCPANGDRESWCDIHTSVLKSSDEELDYFIETYIEPNKVDTTVEVEEPITHDVINHPKHYCREGAMECIEEMIMLFGKEVVKHFCLCNIWKYRYRSADKNGKQDIEKSDQYIRIYKELSEP